MVQIKLNKPEQLIEALTFMKKIWKKYEIKLKKTWIKNLMVNLKSRV